MASSSTEEEHVFSTRRDGVSSDITFDRPRRSLEDRGVISDRKFNKNVTKSLDAKTYVTPKSREDRRYPSPEKISSQQTPLALLSDLTDVSSYNMAALSESNTCEETKFEGPSNYRPAFGYVRKDNKEELTGESLKALNYLKSKKIFELFTFMMNHVLANCPEDPLEFLANLLNCCINFRDHQMAPPLLFEVPHMKAVYRALDPLRQGDISYMQYITGLKTMGLSSFAMVPRTTREGTVREETFLEEAERVQTEELLQLLSKSSGVDAVDSTVKLWPEEAGSSAPVEETGMDKLAEAS